MSAPTVTQELYRIQTDPNASADPIATAYFSEVTTVNGTTFCKELASQVSWRLLGTDKTTTIGGVTLTDAQVSAFVTAIAYREQAAQA